MSNEIYQQRAALLKLRDRIPLNAAPYLVIAELGGMYDDALELVVEAAQKRRFPAAIVPSINPWSGNEIGAVDSEKSTAATADLMAWIATLGINATKDTDQATEAQQEAELSREQIQDESVGTDRAANEELAALFDAVSPEMLKKWFKPKDSEEQPWDEWAMRAKRNCLIEARVGKRRFNPYLAAMWWMKTKKPAGWDTTQCLKVLANHYLPARSLDMKHRFTGDIE
jgi:hypothetical protein